MFYPRKVADKFEADLPPNWYEEATKVPNVGRRRFCPSFMMKFLSDKKVMLKFLDYTKAVRG